MEIIKKVIKRSILEIIYKKGLKEQ